jgi:hypothetical protein
VTVGPLTFTGRDDRVTLLDLRMPRVATSLRLGRTTTALAFGVGSAWIWLFDWPTHSTWVEQLTAHAGRALRIERAAVRIDQDDSWGVLDIAAGEGGVWALTCGHCNEGGAGQTLVRIDPRTRHVLARIPMTKQLPAFLAVGAGSVWVGNSEGHSLSQVDPRTNRIARTIPLGGYDRVVCGVAATDDAVWVTIGDHYCGG